LHDADFHGEEWLNCTVDPVVHLSRQHLFSAA
jgi:hypothetical protein